MHSHRCGSAFAASEFDDRLFESVGNDEALKNEALGNALN
jgi:hypothetical protein